jgi:hypothetical protein
MICRALEFQIYVYYKWSNIVIGIQDDDEENKVLENKNNKTFIIIILLIMRNKRLFDFAWSSNGYAHWGGDYETQIF